MALMLHGGVPATVVGALATIHSVSLAGRVPTWIAVANMVRSARPTHRTTVQDGQRARARAMGCTAALAESRPRQLLLLCAWLAHWDPCRTELGGRAGGGDRPAD